MRNILPILLFTTVCVFFVSCSSGDYTATPGTAGTTISPSSTGGTSTGGTSSGTNTGSVTATINGVSFASSTVIVTTNGGLTIDGFSGSGTAIQSVGLVFDPNTGTGTYTQGTNVVMEYLNNATGVVEQYVSGTAVLTTASAGHYVGTFSASDGANTMTNGKFDVHQ